MAEPSRRRLSPTLLAAIFAAIAVAALVALLVNILARMKGVVGDLRIAIHDNPRILAGTPLASDRSSGPLFPPYFY